RSNTTAQKLLVQVLKTGALERGAMCFRLGIDEARLNAYQRGDRDMPLVVQSRLSKLAISFFPVKSVPAQLGYRLRSQITATISFRPCEPTRRVAPSLPA